MDQRTHAWIALRAMALLEDEKKSKNLVALLKPNAKRAAIGAWIPDLADAKRGGCKTENHVLKIAPFDKDKGQWFVVRKDKLLKGLGKARKMYDYLDADTSLDAAWWKTSYKGIANPGQHLANRAMALSIAIVDQLILGDPKVDCLIPGDIDFIDNLDPKALTSCAQAALYFLMLSHFVADACMPCHCDKRDLSDYGNGLHKQMEKNWAKLVGPEFDKDTLLGPKCSPKDILNKAKDVSDRAGISFGKDIPDIKSTDVWLEVISLCRASFAVASIVAPPAAYAYDAKGQRAPFREVFPKSDPKKLSEFNAVVLHDAVLNTAMIWKHVWNKAGGKN